MFATEKGDFKMSKIDYQELNFEIKWSNEDQVFLANTWQYPSVIAHGDSPQEALHELLLALEGV